MTNPPNTAYKVVYVCLVFLALMGLASFWVTPKFERGVEIAMAAAAGAISTALGFIFGVHIPKPEPDSKPEPKAESGEAKP